MILWQAQHENPEIPLDPELYVASQPIDREFCDPWTCLADEEAGRRYKLRVRQIIRRLRCELRREIDRAERLVEAGQSLESILRVRPSRFSPLALYIVAHHLGGPELAEPLRRAAIEQHKSCPLYRPASLPLLLEQYYPVASTMEDSTEPTLTFEPRRKVASLN
jgi:hypothetical protein